jgi:hypothetical protein
MRRNATVALSSASISWQLDGNLTVVTVATLTVLLLIGFSLAPLYAIDDMTAAELLAELPISDSQKQDIFKGEIVDWVVPWDTSNREVSVGGVLLVKNEPDKIVPIFREAKGYRVISVVKDLGEIKGKATIEDLRGIVLDPNGQKEARRYLAAEPGDQLNLSSKEIALFQDLNASVKSEENPKEKVEKLLRQTLLARYQDYRTKGLLGLAPLIEVIKTFCTSGELVRATKSGKFIAKQLPAFHNYLLKYPDADLPDVEEKFIWANFEVFDRPTFALTHRMLYKTGKDYVFVDRHFYASHDYNVMQAIGGALSTQEGTLVVYLYRVSTDQVAGFGGSVKRTLARSLMETPVGDPATRSFQKPRRY